MAPLEDIRIATHKGHCCVLHGCKYGDEACPVVLKEHRQQSLCEYCEEEGVQCVGTQLSNGVVLLTKPNILAMEPDEIMDAAIAQYVMDWGRWAFFPEMSQYQWSKAPSAPPVTRWRPSFDEADAFYALEHYVGARDPLVTCNFQRSFSGHWRCDFSLFHSTQPYRGSGCSVAHALCKALLLAKLHGEHHEAS